MERRYTEKSLEEISSRLSFSDLDLTVGAKGGGRALQRLLTGSDFSLFDTAAAMLREGSYGFPLENEASRNTILSGIYSEMNMMSQPWEMAVRRAFKEGVKQHDISKRRVYEHALERCLRSLKYHRLSKGKDAGRHRMLDAAMWADSITIVSGQRDPMLLRQIDQWLLWKVCSYAFEERVRTYGARLDRPTIRIIVPNSDEGSWWLGTFLMTTYICTRHLCRCKVQHPKLDEEEIGKGGHLTFSTDPIHNLIKGQELGNVVLKFDRGATGGMPMVVTETAGLKQVFVCFEEGGRIEYHEVDSFTAAKNFFPSPELSGIERSDVPIALMKDDLYTYYVSAKEVYNRHASNPVHETFEIDSIVQFLPEAKKIADSARSAVDVGYSRMSKYPLPQCGRCLILGSGG
jgi:hypothetical protein